MMIDQRLLPNEERYNTYRTVEEVADAIRKMVIRGAPAIGVATAMAIALGVKNLTSDSQLEQHFKEMCELLLETRPTARNLFWAMDRMTRVFKEHKHRTLEEIQVELEREALRIQAEDIEINRRIGLNGQKLLPNESRILTHCNTGSLATAGYGTALGVIRAAVENGKSLRVFADETRPFLQGARLTAWELTREKIPCTLITDSMASFIMKSGRIDAVIVGADRIARNGDVANKIGTYGLAVLARQHGIPFYVAAPLSTIDLTTASGSEIPIEQRDPREVTEINGRVIAPEGIDVENPAFDITQNDLVTAIITEEGVVTTPCNEAIKRLFEKAQNGE
jgi:methylthioribose-1-phosphate isomerase